MADVSKSSSKELTEEVQKELEAAKTEKGHEYRRSPTELFSQCDALDSDLKKLEAYSNGLESISNQKIKTFDQLVSAIKSAVENDKKFFASAYRSKIEEWLKGYDPNPTSEVFSESLKNLKFTLTDGDWANSESFERLHFDITKLLNEYNDSTGELFFFSSIEKVKEVAVESKLGVRDSVIFFLAENGFNRLGDDSFSKDLQGIEINVSFGPDDAQITVSGKQNYDVVVPMSQVQSEIKKWLRAPTQTYSKTSTKTHDSEVQSYSRHYAGSPTVQPAKVESYSQMLRRFANHD